MKNKLLVVDISSLLAGSQKVTLQVMKSYAEKNVELIVLLKERGELYNRFYKDFKNYQFSFHSLIQKYFGTGNFSFSKLHFYDYLILPLLLFITNIQTIFIAKSNNVNVIYCYDPKGIIVCGMFAKIFNLKVIWHLHGKLNYPNALKKFLLSLATEVIVPSESIQDSISRFIQKPKQLEVVYNGFEFYKRNDDSLNKRDDKVINLLYVGTIVPNKGLHSIISNLRDNKLDMKVKLRVLGESVGNIGEHYLIFVKNLCKQLPNNVEVEFCGWVDCTAEYFKCSDLLIFSSLEQCTLDFMGYSEVYRASEALPTVLIESISVGTPVIANRNPGVEEIIYNEQFGVVIKDIQNCDFDSILMNSLKKSFVTPFSFYEKFSLNKMKFKMFDILKRNY
jgi:glycosyltransferase involved in cell wall biosynthesis